MNHAGTISQSPSPVPPVDAGDYRRRERRILLRVCAMTLPFSLVALAFLPNMGPLYAVVSSPSGSMAPALAIGSTSITSRWAYGFSRYTFTPIELPIEGRWPASTPDSAFPRRGDIVTFRLPRDKKTLYVKRVIGLPGDKIQMQAGRLVINGETVPRQQAPAMSNPDPTTKRGPVATYIESLTPTVSYRILETEGDTGPFDNTSVYTVPAGNIFVLGDNRDDSTDSRAAWGVGYVPVELVVGRVEATFGPLAPPKPPASGPVPPRGR